MSVNLTCSFLTNVVPGPVPNLESVSPASSDRELSLSQEKWFQSSTRTLLDLKEPISYDRGCRPNKANNTEQTATIKKKKKTKKKKERENNNKMQNMDVKK